MVTTGSESPIVVVLRYLYQFLFHYYLFVAIVIHFVELKVFWPCSGTF